MEKTELALLLLDAVNAATDKATFAKDHNDIISESYEKGMRMAFLFIHAYISGYGVAVKTYVGRKD